MPTRYSFPFPQPKPPKKILQMFRGNCECGKWLMIHPDTTEDDPLICECGIKYYAEYIESEDDYLYHRVLLDGTDETEER